MPESLIDKTLDHYTLKRLLGKGGMGAVYEGVDTRTGRRVAVKVMSAGLAAREDQSRRFEREARLASEINHPNVARVIESGEAEDSRYLVMEYVDGRSLGEILKDQGRVAGSRCLDIIRQAARGLQAAHDRGIIHRDIKPENLMITNEGELKIVDFGLAKAEGPDSFKTATGVVMGTPHYIPPEQAMGTDVDHRSDIYSLGATFYHMLTGHPPFSGENAFAIIQNHISQEVRAVTSWNKNVPDAVCSIVYRMLSKRPDDRFQTYGHLIQVLEDAIHGRQAPLMTMEVVEEEGDVEIESGGWLTDRMRLVMAGTAFLLIAAGAVGFRFYRAEKAEAAAAARAPLTPVAYSPSEPDRLDWRKETVPMLRDISRLMQEQDEDLGGFTSRRKRMQP